MKKTLRFLVNSIQILSFIVAALVGIVACVYEISFVAFERLMAVVGISDGLGFVWVAGSISTGLMLATYFVKKKYFSQ